MTDRAVAGHYELLIQQTKSQLLPANHPLTQRVAKIVERLLPFSGLHMNKQWKVHVIKAPEVKNAFVLHGGYVFVFSGMIDFARDDDGLAAVLSHEIAHNACHHVSENLSNSGVASGIVYLLATFGLLPISIGSILSSLVYEHPMSRIQEAEADSVGVLMMAQACFDPRASVGLWDRMEREDKSQSFQLLSTHPSHHNRMEHMRQLLPEAQSKAEQNGCSSTTKYLSTFHNSIRHPIRDPS
ncbi:MAG: hypothetical protein Q9227_008189 [Pyrenula ochraceoflavens]